MNADRYAKHSKEYNTPYGSVFINYEAENISVRVSGGFDSALMLYLVAKTINDYNLKSIIRPVTIIKGNPTDIKNYDGFDTYIYSDKIIKWVRSCFPNLIILDSVKDVANYWWITRDDNGKPVGSYTYIQNLISDYMVWRYVDLHDQKDEDRILYCEYVGTTRNPPSEDVPQGLEKHRDGTVENIVSTNSVTAVECYKNHVYVEPFRNADKRLTFWLAHSFEILENLLTITRSCEGDYKATDNFTKECNNCWWCLEREWAKNNFNK